MSLRLLPIWEVTFGPRPGSALVPATALVAAEAITEAHARGEELAALTGPISYQRREVVGVVKADDAVWAEVADA